MSLLFDNQADGELQKFSDYMVSNVYNQNNYQQTTRNQSLSRYHSAPCMFLTSLVDVNGGSNDGNSNVGDENYRNNRSSSPETETVFSRLVSSTNGSDNSRSRFGDMPVKEETQKQNLYHNEFSKNFHNQEAPVSRDNSSFSVPNSLGIERRPIQLKAATRSCSNLARQSSSPAGFFSEMNIENGLDVTSHVGSFKSNSNGTNEDANISSSSAMNSHLNFGRSSSSLRHMPEIAEEVNENIDGSSSQGDRISLNAKICDKIYGTNVPENSWDYSLLRSLKRGKDNNKNVFSTSNIFDIQNEDSGNCAQHLTHHYLSLPVNFNEISTREKILQFQDSIPFKVRARRGCATHPRSIAERVRRTRISERMKKLQDLFPATDKQTSTAEMLDLAVEYIKDLQKQAKALSETRAKCRCLR